MKLKKEICEVFHTFCLINFVCCIIFTGRAFLQRLHNLIKYQSNPTFRIICLTNECVKTFYQLRCFISIDKKVGPTRRRFNGTLHGFKTNIAKYAQMQGNIL